MFSKAPLGELRVKITKNFNTTAQRLSLKKNPINGDILDVIKIIF
jgi:hypothetical protein